MDTFESIEKRHSYRGKFHDEKIDRNDLKKIVKAGITAPSGANAQTTEFIIVDDENILNEIKKFSTNKAVDSAQAIIICIMRIVEIYPGIHFGVEDYSTAVENMLLAITALGYATVWTDNIFIKSPEAALIFSRILGIPCTRQIKVILPVGIPVDQKNQKSKKKFSERAWFNKYKNI